MVALHDAAPRWQAIHVHAAWQLRACGAAIVHVQQLLLKCARQHPCLGAADLVHVQQQQ
jgi:hypothetical protein